MTAPTHHVDVTIRRGGFERAVRIESDARVVALVGASGVGKTSILHAIAGLLRPVSGRIAIGGDVLFDASLGVDVPAHRRRVGYVFQDGRLLPHLDVRANLLFGAPRDRAVPRFAFDDVVALLALGGLLGRRTAGLSGGEVQRVAMGRALLSQPRVLLLDEPLAMLDAGRRDALLPFLERVRDEVALPMVYVSHVPDEIARIAGDVHRIAAD